MSFKPDVTADNEERHKASPYIDPVLQATNDSQGTEKEQLLAYMYSFCRSTWLVI